MQHANCYFEFAQSSAQCMASITSCTSGLWSNAMVQKELERRIHVWQTCLYWMQPRAGCTCRCDLRYLSLVNACRSSHPSFSIYNVAISAMLGCCDCYYLALYSLSAWDVDLSQTRVFKFDHPAKFADQRSMLIVKANDVVVYTSICVTAEGFELLHRAAVRAMQPGSASTQSLAEAEVVASSKKLQLKVSWLESQVVEQK